MTNGFFVEEKISEDQLGHSSIHQYCPETTQLFKGISSILGQAHTEIYDHVA